MTDWSNPLGKLKLKLPPEHGRFAAVRKYDTHAGIDLYAPHGTEVYTVEQGTVVAIEYFTGPSVGMPWWNDTRVILVEGKSGVVVYGEIQEHEWIKVGMKLSASQRIGTVLTVLKKDKDLPMSMLHLELHRHFELSHVWHSWELNETKPEYLLDPTDKLFPDELTNQQVVKLSTNKVQ